jgi:hypothetical protein
MREGRCCIIVVIYEGPTSACLPITHVAQRRGPTARLCDGDALASMATAEAASQRAYSSHGGYHTCCTWGGTSRMKPPSMATASESTLGGSGAEDAAPHPVWTAPGGECSQCQRPTVFRGADDYKELRDGPLFVTTHQHDYPSSWPPVTYHFVMTAVRPNRDCRRRRLRHSQAGRGSHCGCRPGSRPRLSPSPASRVSGASVLRVHQSKH